MSLNPLHAHLPVNHLKAPATTAPSRVGTSLRPGLASPLPPSLQETTAWMREKLLALATSEAFARAPVPNAKGKLLRPLLACALAETMTPRLLEDSRLWSALVALQMVHEASLVHDDIIDEAQERRGSPTLVAQAGIPAALVHGDHLLTTSYRWIAATKHPALFSRFAEAVERTVAGEIAQHRSATQEPSETQYLQIITEKSGYLFGFSALVPALLAGLTPARVQAFFSWGCQLGALYQQLDDLLDYCPHAQSGKPPFQDYQQRKTTLPWLRCDSHDWTLSHHQLHQLFFAPRAHRPPLCDDLYAEFVRRADALEHELQTLLHGQTCPKIALLLQDWKGKLQKIYAQERQHALRTTL